MKPRGAEHGDEGGRGDAGRADGAMQDAGRRGSAVDADAAASDRSWAERGAGGALGL